MEFLGFCMYIAKTKSGTGKKVVWKTERRRFQKGKQKVRETLKRMMHLDLETQAKWINQFLRGHGNYYGMPGNSRKVDEMRYFVRSQWRRCLSRRSQKGRITWEKMAEILKEYPLYSPRLFVTYSKLSSYV